MKRYFNIFILLLVTETAIAIFHFHKFIRGFVGDLLVIPTLYALLRAVTPLSGKKTLCIVMGLAFSVEVLQLFSIADMLHIEHKVARILIGNTFDGWDLVAYGFGILPVLLIEKFKSHGTH
ncbi:MAG: DUF2809 domain-containing protein [Bacteroidota bacterium]